MPQYDSCTNCFMPLNGNTVCPNCGHDKTKERQYAGVLPAFVTLNNKYLVGRVLGKGGFGITYIAMDLVTQKVCAIKEFMPSEYSNRSGGTCQVVPFSDKKSSYVFNHGKEKFVEEARTLLKLKNDPIVVDIVDYFEQNNTAYLVMEMLDGDDLRKMAKRQGGKLDAEFMKTVFVTVASSLMEIHRMNILHRDLSPENIIITKQGNIKLIDFGAARNFVSKQNKGMSILLKPGFAPPEQYNAKGEHGPWSDVYALCATFYNLVSGKPLVDALFRYRGEVQPSLASLGCNVTKKTSDVIEKGMELDYKKRYRDFKELLDDIDITVSPAKPSGQKKPESESTSVQSASTPSTQPMQPTQPTYPMQQARYVSSMSQAQPVSPIPPMQPMQSASPAPPMPQARPVPMQSNTQVQSQTIYTQQPMQPQMVSNSQYGEAAYAQNTTFRPYVAAIVGGGIHNKILISTNDIFKIGRSAQSCQYIITGDTNISRIHCYLRVEGSNLYITDASSNGTFFQNGVRLEKNREYRITMGMQFYLATPNHMLVVGV